jgi:hypothetical protein
MNISEILKSQGRTLPTHPITVRVHDPVNPLIVADAPACLRFVPDRIALEAGDAAAVVLSKLKIQPSPERRAAEEAYYFLAQAIRNATAPETPLFASAIEVQSHLCDGEAMRLRNEYQRFADTHAPQTMTAEQIAEVRRDAETFSLRDLLSRHGYWNVLRPLPFLAIEYGVSLTATSSASTSPST